MIAALIIMMVVLGVSTAVITISQSGADDSQRVTNEREARNAAEVGVQAAVSELSQLGDADDTDLAAAIQLHDSPATAQYASGLGGSCYRYWYIWDETRFRAQQQVVVVAEGLSPQSAGTSACAPREDLNPAKTGRARLAAVVNVTPELLNYALAGDDLWLGQEPSP